MLRFWTCTYNSIWSNLAAPVQVEERLRFYDDGVAPRKNATVMAEAMEKSKAELGDAADVDEPAENIEKKARKKRASV